MATATVVSALAAPAAYASPIDGRGQQPVKVSTPVQGDLRSPDARDAAKHVVITYEPGKVSTPTEEVSQLPSNGFDWGDAGIGAAGMLALVALACGTLLIVGHRRRGRRFPVATS